MWTAAWQCEPCAELQRACCELCRAEQCCEQRGHEPHCCGSRRAGLERFLCDSECWCEWVCGKRLEERQRCCVPQRWGDARRGCSFGVEWCAARQRECCCELRRAERELCWCEQCREQRGDECERVWAGDGSRRAECCRWSGRQRLRCERVAQRQRAFVSCYFWMLQRSGCFGIFGCAAGQHECCCELRRAESELCCAQ